MREKLKGKKIYLIYTGLFMIVAFMVFAIFLKNRCSFIWQADGLKQHYIILRDFHEMIRSFIANPSNGINLFSWNMGLGLDIIGQYSYYVLGDPFAYLSLFFKAESLEYVYTFLILLRMLFVGLVFIYYAKYSTKKLNQMNILIGAILYTFSAFSLYAGVRHPYFLNAMILFPLLLLGVDKLLQENKKVFLCIWIAISAISNYYFFYMHMIMLVIYAVIKYFLEYRKEGIKHFLKKLGSSCICFLIGVLIAGIILFPTIYAFTNSARSEEKVVCQYGIDYYKVLFTLSLLTVNGENWSFIGTAAISLLMLPILCLRRKQHSVYFIYWVIATIILLIPFLGSVMNGFSFPNNRWSFIYCFILAYIVVLCLDKNYTKKEIKFMCLFISLYALGATIAVLITKSMNCFIIYLTQIVIALLILGTILYTNYKQIITWQEEEKVGVLQKINKNFSLKGTLDSFRMIILLLMIVSIGIMSYGLYSAYDRNYAKEFVEVEKCEERLATQLGKNENYGKSIKKIIELDKSFYRMGKVPHQVQNLSIYYGYASTECFLSIGNKYVYQLNKELADNSYSTTSSIRGLGDRTKITTLLGTKYYIADEKNKKSIPYGYELLEENEKVKTYQNKFPLSIGNAYSEYLLKEDYEKLNPIQKEDSLIKAAVIDTKEELKGLNMKKKQDLTDIENSCYTVDYELIDKSQILKEKEKGKAKIVTKKINQKIELKLSEIKDAELYVYISGFEYEGNSTHTITANFEGKSVAKRFENKISSAYYQKEPEILLNLGYYEAVQGNIELTISAKDTYLFDKIEVIAVPMNTYERAIQKLQQNELQQVTCTNQEIKGTIKVEEPSILQITTSYTKGWKAYVDNKKVDTIKVNTAFIGIPIEKGTHEVRLEYEVPNLKLGIISTVTGIIMLSILARTEKLKKKNLS